MNDIAEAAAVPGILSGNVHRALRQGTHERHVRVNRHPLVAGISRKDYRLGDYRRVVVAYHRYYRWLEAAIDAAAPAAGLSGFWAPRRKSSWLAADAAALGLDAEAGDGAPAVSGNAPRSRAELVGAFYATEGSALGGRVIAGHLRRHFGLGADNGARFFRGYGELIDLRWAEFLALAESLAGDADAIDAAVAAAIEVFDGIEHALDE